MVNSRGVARLGMLAVGLGIGAAVASTPGVARADDFQISIDGMDLFSTAGNTATATSGAGDIAIAFGDGATATAEGGTGDYALADGTNALALAGGESSDSGANYDSAIDIGNNDVTPVVPYDGAFAGNGDLDGGASGTGTYDTAIDIGNNSDGDGSFAGAGGLANGTGDGNNDTAIDVGNNSGLGEGSYAVQGNGNYASDSGTNTGVHDGAFAGVGNDNTAINDASGSVTEAEAIAENGNDNVASVLGPENSHAFAGDGDSNIAYILDPFGSTASDANSGAGSSDLAAVLFTDGLANASAGSDLYDILTASGSEVGHATGLLAELLSLF
jgi:hypothetical protein